MPNNSMKPTIKDRKTVRSNISTQFKTKNTDDKFNELELDVLEYVLSHIETYNPEFETISFDVKDFFIETQRNTNTYENVRNALRHLRKSEIIIDNQTYTSWFSSVKVDPNQSFFSVNIDPVIKKHLIGLNKRFVQYQSDAIFRLNGSYSKKFYPFLRSLVYGSKIQKYNLRISHLREILDLSENEYPQYANLKQRIINTIQNEFNAKSDITFEYVEKKENRKVEILQLTITVRDLTEIEFEESSNLDNPVIDFMQKRYHFNEKQILRILKIIPKDKTEVALNADLKEAQKYITKQKLSGKIYNAENIIKSAIKKGWGDRTDMVANHTSNFDVISDEDGHDKNKTENEVETIKPEPPKKEIEIETTETIELIPEPKKTEPTKVKQKVNKIENEVDKIKPLDLEYLEKIQIIIENEYLKRTGKTLDKKNNITGIEIDKDIQTVYFICETNTVKKFIIDNLDFKFKDIANKNLSGFYNFCEITFKPIEFDIEIIVKGKK